MNAIAPVAPPALVAAVTKDGLTNAEEILAGFAPHFQDMQLALETANTVKSGQVRAARASRLELKNIRVAADKTRTRLKASVLLQGRAIDGANNLLLLTLKPAEDRLEEIEQEEARAEAKRKSELATQRRTELSAYCDPTHYNLSEMPEEQYQELLNGAKVAKAAADKKAEEARAAAEQKRKDDEEAERKRKAEQEEETKRLKEAAEKAKTEAEEARTKLAAANAETDAANRRADEEKRKAADAEATAQRERENLAAWKARQPAQAPTPAPLPVAPVLPPKAPQETDKERLTAYARALLEIEVGPMTTTAGQDLANRAKSYLDTVAQRLLAAAANL